MSKEKIDILKDEVVIPEVVTIAAEDALTIILRETSQEAGENGGGTCEK